MKQIGSWHKRSLLRWLVPLFLLVPLGMLGAPPRLAHAGPLLPGHASADKAGQVTILVLDMSGSMSTNDPQGIRCSAANSYIDLSGPGDFIGVVGLDNAQGTTGGPHNFGLADWQIPPSEMDTKAHRQALRDAIQQQSHGCRPDGNTPTYDALAKAEAMLQTATKGGTLGGSVILLTDGQPEPNPQDQITAIEQELVPQFKTHGWEIDTVALGTDQGFHDFLNSISSATSGTFNDDGHGEVQGVSPLNITPFFLQIFALRNGRTPKRDIPPTLLDGGTVSRDLEVGLYVQHLDIVAVKDSQDTQVTLQAPDGESFPPSTAGTFVAVDPYYAIFSIDSPQQGTWTLSVTGSGQFLVNTLKVSTLTLKITAPADDAVQALGEPFTLSAQLSNQGVAISGGKFSMAGQITFVAGSNASYSQDVELSDPTGVGVYSATVTVPPAAPSGSYLVTVTASSASDAVVAAQSSLRLGLFPTALLLNNGQATTGAVTVDVRQWDVVLRTLYSVPGISLLSGWPFAGQLPNREAEVSGQVFVPNPQTGASVPYANATITATARPKGSNTPVAVQVVNDGGGKFHLIFPVGSAGTYEVAITTQGEYKLVHGDLTHATRTVVVTLSQATASQEMHAWAFTGLYLLMLLFLLLFVRYIIAPKPFGALVGRDGEEAFRRWRWNGFFRPSSISSRQMGLEPGVRFYFSRGRRIQIKGAGVESEDFRLNGQQVPRDVPTTANEAQLRTADGIVYTIRPELEEEREQGAEPRGSALRRGARFIWNRSDDEDE